jgi:hypothetical protein
MLAVGSAVLLAGCGSDDEDQTTTSATESTATTSASPSAEGPAGAAVQTCVVKSTELEDLRVTGVKCGVGQQVATGWTHVASCAKPQESSRFACSVRGYRCLSATVDRGVAVTCARPGRSVAFIAPH